MVSRSTQIATVLIGLGGYGLGGCSLLLDPDELVAASREVDASDGAGDVSDGTSADGEVDPGRNIVIAHSGMVACTLDFRIGITQCPETCGTGGWTYVIDASASTGVGAFAWTFEATGGFVVTPRDASGARVSLTIDTPECLIGGTNVKPFSIVARLSVDGGPANPVNLPPISVGQVTTCSGQGSCPDP